MEIVALGWRFMDLGDLKLGFKVEGLRLMVQSLGLNIRGFGFKVWGLGYKV